MDEEKVFTLHFRDLMFSLYVHRACFDKLQVGNYICWLVLDYISDFVYLMDTCVRLRTGISTFSYIFVSDRIK